MVADRDAARHTETEPGLQASSSTLPDEPAPGTFASDPTVPARANVELEAMVMFSIRNLGGIALLLLGSTWLWLTPAFASRGVQTSGVLWATTRVLSLLTVAAFAVATVGLFAHRSWWEGLTLASSALGVVALVAYALAAERGGEPTGTWVWNVFVHVLMLGGVYVLLLVPHLERWVDHHVT